MININNGDGEEGSDSLFPKAARKGESGSAEPNKCFVIIEIMTKHMRPHSLEFSRARSLVLEH